MSDSTQRHYDDDPIVRSTGGSGLPFAEIVERRLRRRDVLKGALGTFLTLSGASAFSLPHPVIKSPTGLDFKPIGPSTAPGVVLSPGYRWQPLLRWGDPMFPGQAEPEPGKMDAATQARCFGYNCDFVGFLPLPYGSENSDRGLLGVNHEYANPELMFPIQNEKEVTAEMAAACMEAMGFSVVEVERKDGRWATVVDSPYNARYTATSPMRVSGPAKADPRMRTSAHPDGRWCRGTMQNCAAGKTPWGTVLSGEENFQGQFGHATSYTSEKDRRSAERYGLGKAESSYAWERHIDRLDCRKEPNEAYTFGWIVEIDPYDPDWTPVKRTALGRFRHEAATSHVTKNDRVVMYSGDDARFEYVYKFVCDKPYDRSDREAKRSLLDEGVLYVARFDEDGTGVWLPLVHGKGPLTAENGFDSQADVVIDARIAADLVGATKMDRPEDIEVNPVNEKVYVVCTNNVDRAKEGKPGTDAANPVEGNRHGHIIELVEADGDHAATTFAWELFMVCGDPADDRTFFAGYPKEGLSPISCPDNICFDPRGNLWIATDGMESALKFRDGFFAVPTEGPERGKLRQFMASVVGSEVCGPEFTPDGTTAFLAIQHPGEGSSFSDPSTKWPDGTGVPRPSVIAVQSESGGVIGS
ncbi:MAG: PhoX family phosphatase [Fimbriimonadaceae bacterium]|nr:PhoX family phosphatase [Fimbriimonadaceae bacterium]QYK55009.1 MAG: PhoX family phosphatase [Fimbriimonadaceae bacterium]